MTLSVDLHHRLGAFELDAAFEIERPADRAVRSVRFRQDVARQPHRRPAAAGQRPYRGGWARARRHCRRNFLTQAQKTHRLRVPGCAAFSTHDCTSKLTLWPLLQSADGALRRYGRSRRASRHRRLARSPAQSFVGRREAARGDRAGSDRQSAAHPDGRAAGVARRGAQGRDHALYRAAAGRDKDPDRLCQPLDRGSGAAGERHRRSGRRQGHGGRVDCRHHAAARPFTGGRTFGRRLGARPGDRGP